MTHAKTASTATLFALVAVTKLLDALIWPAQAMVTSDIANGNTIVAARPIFGALLALTRASTVVYLVMLHPMIGNFIAYQARKKQAQNPLYDLEDKPVSTAVTAEYDGTPRDLGELFRAISFAGIKYASMLSGLLLLFSAPIIRQFFYETLLGQGQAEAAVSANFMLAFAPALPLFIYAESYNNFFLSTKDHATFLKISVFRSLSYVALSYLLSWPSIGNLGEVGLGLSGTVCAALTACVAYYYACTKPSSKTYFLRDKYLWQNKLHSRNQAPYHLTRHGSIAMSSLVFLALIVNLGFSARVNTMPNHTVTSIQSFSVAEVSALLSMRLVFVFDRIIRLKLSQISGNTTAATQKKSWHIINKNQAIVFSTMLVLALTLLITTQLTDSYTLNWINTDEAGLNLGELIPSSKITIPLYSSMIIIFGVHTIFKAALSTLNDNKILMMTPVFNAAGLLLSFLPPFCDMGPSGVIITMGVGYLLEALFFGNRLRSTLRQAPGQSHNIFEKKLAPEAAPKSNTNTQTGNASCLKRISTLVEQCNFEKETPYFLRGNR